MTETIETLTVNKGLCVSCGICAGACASQCISFKKNKGQYEPVIDYDKCIQCGICAEVCPSSVRGEDYVEYAQLNGLEWKNEELLWGAHRGCFSAYCKDTTVRENAVSGGIVTTLVKRLLGDGVYDAAFLVGSHSYQGQTESQKYVARMPLAKTSKSRYIPVSHAEAVRYIMKHPGERIIITGTACAIHGILRIIRRFQLERSNYLLLGLFCDRCERDSIVDYFKDRKPRKKVVGFYFRTKEHVGWPGNVKIEYENGEVDYLSAEKRMRVKKIFQLKRCLYCMDKLNQFADISFGDDYVNRAESQKVNGRSLIILRTEAGEGAFSITREDIVTKPVTMEEVKKAQGILEREQNCNYMVLAREEINTQWYPFVQRVVTKEDKERYEKACELLEIGLRYPDSAGEIKKRNAKLEREKYLRKILTKIKG